MLTIYILLMLGKRHFSMNLYELIDKIHISCKTEISSKEEFTLNKVFFWVRRADLIFKFAYLQEQK